MTQSSLHKPSALQLFLRRVRKLVAPPQSDNSVRHEIWGRLILLDRDQFDERKIAMAVDEMQSAKLNLLSAHAVAQAGIHSICA